MPNTNEFEVYQRNGYANRREYIEFLAEAYGVPLHVVYDVAALLGPDEDFDGLPASLQDYADGEQA